MAKVKTLFLNQKGETQLKALVQIFAIILVVVIIIFTIGKKTVNHNPLPTIQNKDSSSLNIKSSQNNIFPNEVPLNEKTSVYKSGKKTLNTGELIEELIVFNSKKTVLENQKFYEDWARANNWKDEGSVLKEKTASSLSFAKKNKELQISLEQEKNNTTKITMIYSNM